MALKIRPTSPSPKPEQKHPDVELYLDQNEDGSIDVVSTGIPGVKSSRIVRFFDDGSIARIQESHHTRFFHKDDGTGRVVID